MLVNLKRELTIVFLVHLHLFRPTFEPLQIYTIRVNKRNKSADMASMQIVRTSLHNIASSKPKLLAAVTAVGTSSNGSTCDSSSYHRYIDDLSPITTHN